MACGGRGRFHTSGAGRMTTRHVAKTRRAQKRFRSRIASYNVTVSAGPSMKPVKAAVSATSCDVPLVISTASKAVSLPRARGTGDELLEALSFRDACKKGSLHLERTRPEILPLPDPSNGVLA